MTVGKYNDKYHELTNNSVELNAGHFLNVHLDGW